MSRIEIAKEDWGKPDALKNALSRASAIKNEALKCPGVGRDAENEKSLCFYFNRKVTDIEMRYLHEVMERAVACSPK